MAKRWLALGIAFVIGASTALAGERTVYRGKLGTQDVVLELERDGDQYEGRYFYQRIGVNIPLHGTPGTLAEAIPLRTLENTSFGPVFVAPDTGRREGVWAGRVEGDHYTGTWSRAGGRPVAFDLRRVAIYTAGRSMTISWRWLEDGAIDDSASITVALDPYNYLRMHEVQLAEEAEVVSGSVAYRIVRDPRVRFPYPRLTRHPDPAVLARTNAELEQRQWRANLEALECAATAYASIDFFPSLAGEDVQVTYVSPTLMSIVQSGSNGCGGPHPNNHFDPVTLDLRRGGELDFNRLLAAYGANFNNGRRLLTPGFRAFIEAKVQQVAAARKEGCAVERLPRHLALYFQADGKLTFDTSDVEGGACLGDYFTPMPLRDLGPLLRPGAAEYFPTLRR